MKREFTADQIWAAHSHIFEIADPVREFAGQLNLSIEDAEILHEGLAKGEPLDVIWPRLSG